MASPDAEAVQDEKAVFNEAEAVGGNKEVVDDKGLEGFDSRPSEDPNDPLNWSLPLKVCLTRGGPDQS